MKDKLRSRWPLVFSITLALLLLSYYLYLNCVYPADRAVFIIAYGILSSAVMLFLTFYVLRKDIYRYRLGSRQGWLQAHIYTGIISLVLLFMHFSFKPTGTFGIFLTILFLLAIFSGTIGSLIYIYVPPSLSKHGRKVYSEEEIALDTERCLKDADDLVSAASGELRDLYEKSIRPFMASKRTKWEYLLMEERELIEKRRHMIEGYKIMVRGRDMHDLNLIGSLLAEKEKLSFMQAKLRLQGAWLTFHMPVSAALLTAAAIHIVTVLYY